MGVRATLLTNSSEVWGRAIAKYRGQEGRGHPSVFYSVRYHRDARKGGQHTKGGYANF